jgi:2-dehydro-3-deoxy-D-arabinonate dehydratase
MKLGQIKHDGRTVAAIFEDGQARPVPAHSLCDLIHRSEAESIPLSVLAASLASRHAEPAALLIPIHPVEVWACGCTYETSATFRDAEHGSRQGMYAYVYRSDRPEIFFKGTSRV